MKNRKNIILISFLSTVALLFIVYFAIVRPLSETVETTPPPTTGPGEDMYGNRLCLFRIPRDEIHAITIYNDSGEFSFCRLPATEGATVDKTSPFVLLVKEEGKDSYIPYAHVKYDEEEFASLIVGTGTTYVLPQIVDSALSEGSNTLDNEILKEYGLAPEDNPAYYEIQTLDGHIERVYVGNKAVTENGYYIRREGYGGIYVSQVTRIGDVAKAEAAAFVEPILVTLPYAYAYFYAQNFSLWSKGETFVTAEDAVTVRFSSTVDGVSDEVAISTLDMRTCREALRTLLVGKSAGVCDLSVDITYESDDEGIPEAWRGKTVTHRISEILRVEKLFVSLNFLNKSERDSFLFGTTYAITAPSSMLPYVPHTSHYMDVLEDLGTMEGIKTVSLGLTAEKIEEYGLTAHRVYYEFPTTYKEDPKKPGDYIFETFMRNELYISEMTEKGTYYVASLLHDIVAEVAAEKLSFVEEPASYWFADEMFLIKSTDVKKLVFSFTYRDYAKTFTFDLYQKNEEGGVSLNKVYLTEGTGERREIDVNAFLKMYATLTSTYYDGDVPKETADSLMAGGESILTFSVTLTNGSEYVYTFYPYTERRVLVSVGKKGATPGGYFYITADEPEKIAADIEALMAGQIPSPDKRY